MIILSAFLLISTSAFAGTSKVTFRGPIRVGTITSAIEGIDLCYGIFLTEDSIADEIFSKCKFLDDCEIVCEVGENNFIDKVYSARKINLATEPTSELLKAAACSAFSISDDICSSQLGPVSIEVLNSKQISVSTASEWEFTLKISTRKGMCAERFLLGTKKVYFTKSGDAWNYSCTPSHLK